MNLVEQTIGQCLEHRAFLTPLSGGISDESRCFQWKQVQRLSDHLAVRYIKMGIRRGSHAAIWSLNSPEYVLCMLALHKIGAVAVLVNTAYKAKELLQVLAESEAQFLFYGEDGENPHFETILGALDWQQLSVRPKCVKLERAVQKDAEGELPQEDRKLLEEAESLVKTEDTACILFTSGTTSRPKGVMLSHRSLVNNSLEMSENMHWTSGDLMCIPVPLFHCFGITAGILCGIHAGAELHLLKHSKSKEIMEQVQKRRCTVLSGVPTMFLALVRNRERKNYRLDSLKSGIIAGSPVTPSEYLEICRELGMEKLQPSYGQTESSPCITMAGWDDSLQQKAKTVGRAISHVEICIKKDGGAPADGLKDEGEILTRGYHVMQGYYHRPEETKRVIDQEGWLHTGDIGYLDENGCLSVIGRKKEMIIRGGENISPLEIEQCILELPQVAGVKVVGVEAEVLKEEIAACILVKAGRKLTGDQVRLHVKAHLANYKVPKYVCFLSEFPITASGKPCLGTLKELAQREKEKQDNRI